MVSAYAISKVLVSHEEGSTTGLPYRFLLVTKINEAFDTGITYIWSFLCSPKHGNGQSFLLLASIVRFMELFLKGI